MVVVPKKTRRVLRSNKLIQNFINVLRMARPLRNFWILANQPSTSRETAVPIKSIPSWQMGLMGKEIVDSSEEEEPKNAENSSKNFPLQQKPIKAPADNDKKFFVDPNGPFIQSKDLLLLFINILLITGGPGWIFELNFPVFSIIIKVYVFVIDF